MGLVCACVRVCVCVWLAWLIRWYVAFEYVFFFVCVPWLMCVCHDSCVCPGETSGRYPRVCLCYMTHVYVCWDSCLRVSGLMHVHSCIFDISSSCVGRSPNTHCVLGHTVCPDIQCHTVPWDCVSHKIHSVSHTCVSSRHTVSHIHTRLCVSWGSQCHTHMCVVPTHSVTQSHETVCLMGFSVFHTHVCRPDTRWVVCGRTHSCMCHVWSDLFDLWGMTHSATRLMWRSYVAWLVPFVCVPWVGCDCLDLYHMTHLVTHLNWRTSAGWPVSFAYASYVM